MEHLDSLLKLKEERIDELQSQLERKQARRKDLEALSSNISMTYETVCPTIMGPKNECIVLPVKTTSLRTVESKSKMEESKIPVAKDSLKTLSRPSITEVVITEINDKTTVDRIKSDVFKETEYVEEKSEGYQEGDMFEDFKDSEQEDITTIEETIQKEIKDIIKPMEFAQDMSLVN